MAVEMIFEQDAYARSCEAEDIGKKHTKEPKAQGGEAGRAVLFRHVQQELGVEFGCCHSKSFHGAPRSASQLPSGQGRITAPRI